MSGNGNDATSITTQVTITREYKVTLVKGDGVSKVGDNDSLTLTCNMSKDSDSCIVTLPNITPTDSTFTGYWSTTNSAQSGIAPGSNGATLTLTKDETYYALVKKDITVTYLAGTGYTIKKAEFSGTVLEFISQKSNASGKTYGSSGADNTQMFDTGYGYRYLGDSPSNYVKFNGETWRIIGVFNDPDSSGDTSPKMKIMRDASIGDIA